MHFTEEKQALLDIQKQYKEKGVSIKYKGIRSDNKRDIEIEIGNKKEEKETYLFCRMDLATQHLDIYRIGSLREEELTIGLEFYEQYCSLLGLERRYVKCGENLIPYGYTKVKENNWVIYTKKEATFIQNMLKMYKELEDEFLCVHFKHYLQYDGYKAGCMTSYTVMKESSYISLYYSETEEGKEVYEIGKEQIPFYRIKETILQELEGDGKTDELNMYLLQAFIEKYCAQFRYREIAKRILEGLEIYYSREEIEKLAVQYIKRGYETFVYDSSTDMGWLPFGEYYVVVTKNKSAVFQDKKESIRAFIQTCGEETTVQKSIK